LIEGLGSGIEARLITTGGVEVMPASHYVDQANCPNQCFE
jgi:hypothetical protein